MRFRFRRKREEDHPVTHDEAMAALEALERDQAKLARYEGGGTNDGYRTPGQLLPPVGEHGFL